jgi:hypothetical protein
MMRVVVAGVIERVVVTFVVFMFHQIRILLNSLLGVISCARRQVNLHEANLDKLAAELDFSWLRITTLWAIARLVQLSQCSQVSAAFEISKTHGGEGCIVGPGGCSAMLTDSGDALYLGQALR